MLDTSLYTKTCKDAAELAVCQMLLNKVPAERELEFDILYNAADRMDEDDTLTSVDKVIVALINCDDPDVITVSKAEWVKEMRNRFFDVGGPGEDLDENAMKYFYCENIVSNLEAEYRDECDCEWSGFHDEEDQPATLYDYLKAHGDRMYFEETDYEQYALKLICDGRVCGVEDYFMEEEYAESFFTIGGSQTFGPEVYEKDGVVLTTPNFNYEIAQPLALVCEELVHATRNGEPTEALTQEAMDIVDALVDTSVAQTEQLHSVDDLIKAAEGYFTYPEGFNVIEERESATPAKDNEER